MASMFEEFEIHPLTKPLFSLGGHPITFSNSSLFMFLAIVMSTMLMVVAMRRESIIPNRWQMLAETIHNMIYDMVRNTAGDHAKPYFPFIFTIFLFVLFCNLLGLLPGSLAVTSHIIVNLAIALFLFLVIIVAGFMHQGVHFLRIFAPPGVPIVILPFLILIELFSFLVRPFSLSIRLFANMLAGHILLGVFAGMTISLFGAAGLFLALGVLPLLANIAITGFEFFVALIQAYIYAILATVYLRDAVEAHH